MYRIDQHKNIYLSRGDDFSYTFPVYVDNSETAYKFEKNDGCMLFFYIFIPNSINYEFVMKMTGVLLQSSIMINLLLQKYSIILTIKEILL